MLSEHRKIDDPVRAVVGMAAVTDAWPSVGGRVSDQGLRGDWAGRG